MPRQRRKIRHQIPNLHLERGELKQICNYKEFGRYQTQFIPSHAIIEALQTTFVKHKDIVHDTKTACKFKNATTMENDYKLIPEQRSLARETITDPENPCFQCLYKTQQMNNRMEVAFLQISRNCDKLI